MLDEQRTYHIRQVACIQALDAQQVGVTAGSEIRTSHYTPGLVLYVYHPNQADQSVHSLSCISMHRHVDDATKGMCK